MIGLALTIASGLFLAWFAFAALAMLWAALSGLCSWIFNR